MKRTLIAMGILALLGTLVSAQDPKPPSPDGTASAQVLGKYVKPEGRGAPALGGANYEGGKWIEIVYGRPLKRGRDPWGAGATYGRAILVGSPIWRAGANNTTRLRTEAPLVIGGKTIAPGEYTLFIDLKENNWTFVVSSWKAQIVEDMRDLKTALWGSYGYTPDKDVVRVPMKLETLPHAVEELTWSFVDMTNTSGTIALEWDKQFASVPFTVAQ
jgi:Protein of unknown function (DUF2911)